VTGLEKIFEPEVVTPEGMFEPGLQFLIEQIAEASEALDYYVVVNNTATVEMDQHTTIVIHEAKSALIAVLVFLKQLQEYERVQAQAAAV
jgi:hypothetical protein